MTRDDSFSLLAKATSHVHLIRWSLEVAKVGEYHGCAGSIGFHSETRLRNLRLPDLREHVPRGVRPEEFRPGRVRGVGGVPGGRLGQSSGPCFERTTRRKDGGICCAMRRKPVPFDRR